MNMSGKNRGKPIPKNKIFNKNYGNKVKKNRKGNQGRNNDGKNHVDERAQLQKDIDEKLEALVEENKRKQYEEQWKSHFRKGDHTCDNSQNGGNEEDESNTTGNSNHNDDKKKEKNNKVYKNNLTIIDKNVLTEHEFKALPISKRTLRALDENNFVHMTNIQAVSIPIVLLNKHIYAQAQTGTGKTLCFCVPLVEKLYRNSIDNYNRILGGLIITPTRELVFQIFEVLNMLNKYHKLNICCAIGGKDEEREKSIFSYANIIVCTTGRLLYHLENNYYCNLDYLSTLVIDEIDKLIDSSFYDNLKNILLYKPKENCQICLFSATICKFLSIILRTFNIKDYEYVSINDNDKYIESNNVKQIYIECDIYSKINYLYTFLFSKKNKKIIVFFSTCKQVRFMYEVFRKIKVGVMKFLQLHGKLKQTSRLNTYHFFSKKRNFVCLFTTDIACRGLDFASVDWVIHFDFPENVETFIHRSGRTGRFTNVGNSLIFLTTEIDNKKIFLNVLKENNIEIKEKFIKKNKLFDINNKIHSLNAAFVDIKYLAKKALIIYLRHLYIVMKFKDIKKLNLNQLAYSYGLIEFSSSMMEELNIDEHQKVEVKKKRSRFEKFMEILKRKKLKGGSTPMEGEKNQGDVPTHEPDGRQDTDDNSPRDAAQLPDLGAQEEEDLFIKKEAHIEEDCPVMLPTQKRKKRVKVAKTLSKSVLYDDNGNEINDDGVKLKILVNELNEDTKDDVQGTESEHDSDDDGEGKDQYEGCDKNAGATPGGNTYIQLLREKIQKENEKRRMSKLRYEDASEHPNNSEEYSDDATDSPTGESDESGSSQSDELSGEKLEGRKDNHTVKRKKALLNKGKLNATPEENENEDISDLESKVMQFL
ncbi:DEAD/DEAH box ATP-dependent RNA helicase, putative [Plasmodium knowlesi strain H]|uniref:ATP-dependent RNA helicase n=3 Tax=Plasmodium knowlesi TaxID=5850 RepID=A0A5E7X5H2_PLAKH|nr:ATP-dependent RNA helicase DBP4, putative [Plasmodium knowlesi strain H]OTN67641.1 putative DEAD/DEAH box ATP-dependent RNA helicase [Plasmodium knowlesi]CAA9990421.1 ATP-dependent RNA helicase DBP4, putative [Plasmodium knowlesi strain H]SBO19627.1 DEAD/DEAH box ATP-dependent RNA helicase, putative [Plasmodium knowlesi strain H]SBO22578.1 DEAD/DEAH box ATP-dependent RNA helicase, putative [Plasmodium knowlesi strain H]VVS79895.1 ATP-dependent RNA helicase DBP4, putative [Plasmodium knowles